MRDIRGLLRKITPTEYAALKATLPDDGRKIIIKADYEGAQRSIREFDVQIDTSGETIERWTTEDLAETMLRALLERIAPQFHHGLGGYGSIWINWNTGSFDIGHTTRVEITESLNDRDTPSRISTDGERKPLNIEGNV